MKRVYSVIMVIALITCLQGIAYVIEGIQARGLGGVNYGRVLFPLLIAGISFWQIKKRT